MPIKTVKLYTAWLALLLLLTFTAPALALAAGNTAALLPFTDTSGKQLGTFVTDKLTENLLRHKIFQLIERDKLKTILNEQKLARKAPLDPSSASAVGKLVGADYTIIGSVDTADMEKLYVVIGNQYTAKVQLSVKIIDNATGEIIAAETAVGTDETVQIRPFSQAKANFKTAAMNSVDELATKLNKRYPLTGKIAALAGQEIYINLGSDSGVSSGDTFFVYETGNPVFDPDTGALLTVQKTKIAALRITRVEAKTAIGQLTQSHKPLKVGQLVKRD